MSFFKIEKSGCNVRNGLLQVRYDLFWDETEQVMKILLMPHRQRAKRNIKA
jgi:hypothetical protein